ncbi:MAG: hypothetical protein ABI398_03040 [Devosia sp.]
MIVEEEFLIALDIQRVLESVKPRRIVFARNFEEVAQLGDRVEAFDLAVITAPRNGTTDYDVARRLVAAGVALVVCSAMPKPLVDDPIEGAEIVGKPFADADLLAACSQALQRYNPA